jgi:hypothetical protein
MAAPKVEIVKDADGGYSVVGTADGCTLTFATVNPSQVNVARAEQGLPAVETDAEPETDEAA